jgi:hypothetical protein
VEGIALGIMADPPAPGAAFFAASGGPWDWACEVACACCGLLWSPGGALADPALLGGPRFNHEAGRQPYHDRERDLGPGTLFTSALGHGELLLRLQRLNRRLGWDHATEVRLPLSGLAGPEARAALWSTLYAGAHALLEQEPGAWDPDPFRGVLEG